MTITEKKATMRVTILVDNQVSSNLKAEHGFSVLIESDGQTILLDTGQGDALFANARALDVDLGRTDILVLSHGHYDHTGGIPMVMQQASDLRIWCHPGVVQPRYAISNGTPRAIHMPHAAMAAMDSLPPRQLHWVSKNFMLSENIGITGPIPRETDFEDTGGPFFLDMSGKRPDPIADDLAIWLQTDDGVVILTGCCHSGVVNTVNHVRRLTGNAKIRALIGGFHLIQADDRRIEKTAEKLSSLDLDRVIACHCTGKTATASFKSILGDRVVQGHSGMIMVF
jgi:7,8-dihydropterin-6-yl-methyl-4-(beta-D-ribofuranosyl)aminobenzene 5'-phosphate synthase